MTEQQNPKHNDTETSVPMSDAAATPAVRDDTDVPFVSEDAYESDTEILQLLQILREETKDRPRSDAFAALCTRFRPLTERMVTKYASGLSASVSASYSQKGT